MKRRRPNIHHHNNTLANVISRIVHKDDFVLFEAKRFWETLHGVVFYADDSEIVEYADRVLFIRANNSVIKNEILLKKDEIQNLINVYLHDKLKNDKYPVKRVIVK